VTVLSHAETISLEEHQPASLRGSPRQKTITWSKPLATGRNCHKRTE